MKSSHKDLGENITKLVNLVWSRVSLEAVIVSVNIKANQPSHQADLMVRGVWEGNWVAFFDNHIVHADAPSYVKANLSWQAVANHTIAAKKAKYRLAIEDLCSSSLLWYAPWIVHSIGNMLLISSG